MQIKIADLRTVALKIFEQLEKSGNSVEVDADFYWNIPAERRYDQYEEPSALDVGQLSEDWDRLLAILHGQSPPVAAAAGWLGDILKAVAPLSMPPAREAEES